MSAQAPCKPMQYLLTPPSIFVPCSRFSFVVRRIEDYKVKPLLLDGLKQVALKHSDLVIQAVDGDIHSGTADRDRADIGCSHLCSFHSGEDGAHSCPGPQIQDMRARLQLKLIKCIKEKWRTEKESRVEDLWKHNQWNPSNTVKDQSAMSSSAED